MNVQASELDGEWTGRLSCSRLLEGMSGPSSTAGAYSEAVAFSVRSTTVQGAVDSTMVHEAVLGSFDGYEMRLTFEGNRKDRPAWWQINLSGPVTAGVANLKGTMTGRPGVVIRNCALQVSSVRFQQAQKEAALMKSRQDSSKAASTKDVRGTNGLPQDPATTNPQPEGGGDEIQQNAKAIEQAVGPAAISPEAPKRSEIEPTDAKSPAIGRKSHATQSENINQRAPDQAISTRPATAKVPDKPILDRPKISKQAKSAEPPASAVSQPAKPPVKVNSTMDL